ncbi:MAG: PEP-CTERM system TPR-repeat protein PrsT [Pseudomonadales bacterium]|nr:PEP-CTERM system TPR-repeat protein PrsT [Pseudomonadales bacterium]
MNQTSIRGIVLVTLLLVASACDSKTAEQHFADAELNIANAEERVAVIELKNAVQKNPQYAAARSLLGQMHFMLGDMPSALKELERALDLGLDDETTRLHILKTKLAMGRYSEVVGELEEASSLSPPFAVALADAYIFAGDFEKAKPLVEQGLHLADGLVSAAKLAQVENDLERAQSYLDQSVTKAPRLTNAWLYKAEVELMRGAGEAAKSSFETAASLPGGDVTGTMGAIRAMLVLEDLLGAAALMEPLVARAPEYPPAQYLNGLIKFRQGDIDGAEAALRVVQQYASDHLPTLYLMGVVKSQQGQFNQAADNLRRYLARDGENLSVRKLLATIYAEDGKSDEVVELLKPLEGRHADPQVWALLGSAALREGDMGAATDAFQKAVELAPDMAPFRNQLALSLLSSGDEEAAKSELAAAVELDGDQFQSDYILVMVEARKGNFAAAQEAVARIIAKSPDNPIGYNLRGAAELAQGSTDAATASFREALVKDATYYPAASNLVRVLEQAEDFAGAEAVLAQVLTADAENEAAQLGLADFLVRRGEVDRALDQLEATVGQFPESVRARIGQARLLLATRRVDDAERAARDLISLAPDLPDALLLKAEVDLASGDSSGAQSAVAKLQSQLAGFGNNPQLLAAVGNLQLRTGELTLARKNLETVIELGQAPASVRADLIRLELQEGNASGAAAQLAALEGAGGGNAEQIALLKGEVLLASGDRDEALAHFANLAEGGSRVGTTRYALLLSSQGRNQDAESILQNWLTENPGDTGVRMALANVGVQHGELAKAKAEYEALMPSDDPVLLNNLAWIYMAEGDERAEDVARRAYAVLPNNADIADTLGWILVQKGSEQEGLQLLRSSARNKPQDPAIQYHLAVAFERTGNQQGAREALQRALANDGDFEGRSEAQTLLERLN